MPSIGIRRALKPVPLSVTLISPALGDFELTPVQPPTRWSCAAGERACDGRVAGAALEREQPGRVLAALAARSSPAPPASSRSACAASAHATEPTRVVADHDPRAGGEREGLVADVEPAAELGLERGAWSARARRRTRRPGRPPSERRPQVLEVVVVGGDDGCRVTSTSSSALDHSAASSSGVAKRMRGPRRGRPRRGRARPRRPRSGAAASSRRRSPTPRQATAPPGFVTRTISLRPAWASRMKFTTSCESSVVERAVLERQRLGGGDLDVGRRISLAAGARANGSDGSAAATFEALEPGDELARERAGAAADVDRAVAGAQAGGGDQRSRERWAISTDVPVVRLRGSLEHRAHRRAGS